MSQGSVADGLAAGRVIGARFKLVKRLGSGGFAEVWLAEDGPVPVALKVMHAKLRAHRELVDRFEAEAKIMANLRHPGIARATGLDREEGMVFYAMEYIGGRTLRDELLRRAKSDAPYSPDEVIKLVTSIGETLDYAHKQRLVHRDLKPANLILVPADHNDGHPIKLVDFGIAKDLEVAATEATTAGRTLGSFAYMSPEQTRSAPITVQTDVFALGACFFELLTLRRAWLVGESGEPQRFGVPGHFHGPNMPAAIFDRINRGPRPKASPYLSGLTSRQAERVDLILAQAMAVLPSARFESAGLLALALASALRAPEPASSMVAQTTEMLIEPQLGADSLGVRPSNPSVDSGVTPPDRPDGGWPSNPPFEAPKAAAPELPPLPSSLAMVIPQPFTMSDMAVESRPALDRELPHDATPRPRMSARDPASLFDKPAPIRRVLGLGYAIAARTSTQLRPLTSFDRHVHASGLRVALRVFLVLGASITAYFAFERGIDLRVGGPALALVAAASVLFVALVGLGERRTARLLSALTGLRAAGASKDLGFRLDGADGERGYLLSLDTGGLRAGVLADARRLRIRLKTSPKWRHAWASYEAQLSVTLPDDAEDVLGATGQRRAFPLEAVVNETLRAGGIEGPARRAAMDSVWVLRQLHAHALETDGRELVAVVSLEGSDSLLMAESLASAARAVLMTAVLLWTCQVPTE